MREWDRNFTPRMKQELHEAEEYVKAFGTENTYASHMVLMATMAKLLDGYEVELIKADEKIENFMLNKEVGHESS